MSIYLQAGGEVPFCICMSPLDIVKFLGTRILIAAIPVALVCYALGQLSALAH
jgi:hypothetical protein